MSSLLNRVRDGGESSSDEYTRVREEERKPLNAYHEETENDVQTAAEIYALKRTIKRTNLYLKVLVGLLSVTILALLSLQGPSAYKTIKEVKDRPKEAAEAVFQEAPKPKQMIKTPVPDIPMSKVTFEENKIYSERPNPESDAAWDALLPVSFPQNMNHTKGGNGSDGSQSASFLPLLKGQKSSPRSHSPHNRYRRASGNAILHDGRISAIAILRTKSVTGQRRYVGATRIGKDSKEAENIARMYRIRSSFGRALIKHLVRSTTMADLTLQRSSNIHQDGRGFVFIDNWKDYDLPPGEETEWGMIYSVAVFHQMHCLGQLRRFSWMFLDAITKNKTQEQAAITEMFEKQNHASHLHHCFDYLRQTIACGGDMAMEWPRTEKDGRRFAVDGWGIPHECKNWASLMLIFHGLRFANGMFRIILWSIWITITSTCR
ncbi:hypothetical protein E2P81_ATG09330 [Venturia nashicola]|nr:hypothetical protein E2P81_ATG09330 [Venturia nashicola]